MLIFQIFHRARIYPSSLTVFKIDYITKSNLLAYCALNYLVVYSIPFILRFFFDFLRWTMFKPMSLRNTRKYYSSSRNFHLQCFIQSDNLIIIASSLGPPFVSVSSTLLTSLFLCQLIASFEIFLLFLLVGLLVWLITNQGLFSHYSFLLHLCNSASTTCRNYRISIGWLTLRRQRQTGTSLAADREAEDTQIAWNPTASIAICRQQKSQADLLPSNFQLIDFRLSFHSNSIGMRGVSSLHSIFCQMSDNPEWFLAVSCLFVNFSAASTNCTLLTMTQTSSLSAPEMDSTCSSAIFTR